MDYTFLLPAWPLRLPGVRHVRAALFAYRCNRHYEAWRQVGFFGGWSDEEVAYHQAIQEGRA